MSEINDWNIAAANNNDTPPDGWPENTMQYSEVNDTAREGMAVVARYFQDINGSLQFAGSVNAYTVVLNAAYVAYFQGMYLAAEINITNTGAVTINVNGIGVKTVVDQASAALTAGDLVAGGVYEFRYDGTNFQLFASTIGDDSITTAMLQDDAVTTLKILDANVTLAKLADMATDSFIGRDTAATGVPEILSAAVARGVLNVEDNSAADQTAGEIEAIVDHDNLLGFVSEEHIRWDITGGEDVHTDRVPLATESAVGGLEVATQVETDAGTLDTKIITPEKLAAHPGLQGAQFKQKAADESVMSSTTLQDDDHLIGFNLVADKWYRFHGVWVATGINSGDLKYEWEFTNTPQSPSTGGIHAFQNLATGLLDTRRNVWAFAGTGERINLTSTIQNMIDVWGFFQANASTGGTMKLTWAQDQPQGTPTIIEAGSYVELYQLD